ncbi:IclR family transcriptional regulator [Novosphingobium sp. 9U]|uniref:IclR family transcriptional regulator n=1 Tax=Novosphingobium sp. 9U TaxID=2653158 RepID=UPI0012EFC1A2|nr:IclR family transcriptional regulator [Novosphingobium sp. 9U]VWX54219.1 Transcriptional regulator, IclR family [Novosphingobium sp. 9U]
MPVKRGSSGRRMLEVFEAVAASQPIGVSALARLLEADKSAVQRDLMTLADAGWIRAAQSGWELTPRILTLARTPHSSNDLRQRARPVLEALRSSTGETTYLTVPDGENFVVIDALESPQVLRTVPPIGLVVPTRGSATARAVLPYMGAAEQRRLLGADPTKELLDQFAHTRLLGFAVNDGDIVAGAVAIASAILDTGDRPLGALVVTAPAERLDQERRERIGLQLVEAVRTLGSEM